MHGRPGPVLVDIPKDVQFATAPYVAPEAARTSHYAPRTKGDPAAILAAVEALERAERPILYSGGGVINAGPAGQRAPARAGRRDRLSDHLDADGPRRLSGLGQGLAGHARHARHLRGQLGDARLRRDGLHRRALRRPHHRPARRLLARIRFKIHIDIDPSSINKNVHVDVPIVGDVGSVLDGHAGALEGARVARPTPSAVAQVVAPDRALARQEAASPTATPTRSSSRSTRSSGSRR